MRRFSGLRFPCQRSAVAVIDEHSDAGIGVPVAECTDSRCEQKEVAELPFRQNEDFHATRQKYGRFENTAPISCSTKARAFSSSTS